MKKDYLVFTINKEVRPDDLAPQDWQEASDGIARYQRDGYQIEGISTTSVIPGLLQ